VREDMAKANEISDSKDKEIERLREDIDRPTPSQSRLESIMREKDVFIAGLVKDMKNANEISDSKDKEIAELQVNAFLSVCYCN
jgi:hypothetical protein